MLVATHGALDAETPAGRGDAEFRELADKAPVMIWRVDADGQFIWFNRPWLEFVGSRLEDQVGQGWRDGVHPDDVGRWMEAFADAFAHQRPFSIHYRLKRHDGTHRWVLDKGAPFDRDGAFGGYFGSCVDVSELFELQAHKDVLLAELNHRVKNNLQLVIAFLTFSLSRARGEEARELLSAAIRRVQGVGAVQERLLENGTGAVDLADYLPRIAQLAAGADGGTPPAMAVDVAHVMSTPPQASSLGLIVNELIAQAMRRAARSSASVTIHLTPLGDRHAVLVIRDEGPDTPTTAEDPFVACPVRSVDLVEALARHARASISREGLDGRLVRLVFPTA